MVKSQTLESLVKLGTPIKAKVFRRNDEISGRLTSYDDFGYTIKVSAQSEESAENYFIPKDLLMSLKFKGVTSRLYTADNKETVRELQDVNSNGKKITFDRVNNHLLIDGEILKNQNSDPVTFGEGSSFLLSELLKYPNYRASRHDLMATGIYKDSKIGFNRVIGHINEEIKSLGYRIVSEKEYIHLVF
ncbi:MAG: hypothetical protein AABX94_01765 [Nanoarchaeota archaeon]